MPPFIYQPQPQPIALWTRFHFHTCTLQGDAPGLKLLPPTPPHTKTAKFGVGTASKIDDDVRRALAANHLHYTFAFSSSSSEDEDDDDDDDDFASPCRSSNIDHAVKEAISQVQI